MRPQKIFYQTSSFDIWQFHSDLFSIKTSNNPKMPIAWKFIPYEAKVLKINLEYQNSFNISYKLIIINPKVEENCHFWALLQFDPIILPIQEVLPQNMPFYAKIFALALINCQLHRYLRKNFNGIWWVKESGPRKVDFSVIIFESDYVFTMQNGSKNFPWPFLKILGFFEARYGQNNIKLNNSRLYPQN